MVSSDHWYKNAIIYALDVEKFQDGDGDGVGDFEGLTRRLDYLSGIGVTCLWLLPFYPSPERDNGYDVTDYFGVNPRYGTLGHFVDFMREARERGIRVLIDLVVNHTSYEHPWFQAARADPNSRYREYYVWKENPEDPGREHVAFPGEQERIWTYDEKAKAHYLHHFYEFQPDLNVTNPRVREEILRVMGFWLELGVSGCRVDAAPFLVEDTSLRAERGPGDEPMYEFLRDMREFLDRRRGDAILLAEANVPRERLPKYFADGEQFQMLFGFIPNQYLFLAMAREQAAPLADGLRRLPEMPWVCQWANFVRNHDELALDRLSESEREEVFRAFGPEPAMQIFHRGIRRRLPPMLGGDARRIRLAYSLLLTLPGTPVIRYGEEIGMGDDLSLDGRESVRTAMQWTGGQNAGFSQAPADRLQCPLIREGDYGYKRINVADQDRDPDSLLNWFEHALRVRKRCPEFGRGSWQVLGAQEPAVFAHGATSGGGVVVAAHNLAGRRCRVALDLRQFRKQLLVDLLGDRAYQRIDGTHDVELEPYDFRWFRLEDERELTV